MIFSAADRATQDIFDGVNSKAARKVPLPLHEKARRLLDLLNAAKRLEDLKMTPGTRLEALKGDLKGFHSIRVNQQWRIIFEWNDGDVRKVKITDYHS